jgi:hypothetical protein
MFINIRQVRITTWSVGIHKGLSILEQYFIIPLSRKEHTIAISSYNNKKEKLLLNMP